MRCGAFSLAGAPEWDAAIDGSRSAEPRVPSADEFDLRGLKGLPVEPPAQVARELDQFGSNNWAVAGSRTSHGAAMVANDMHLDFRVPNIWYRARLVLKGDARSHGRDAARHAVHRRRQQSPHRLGLHEQLRCVRDRRPARAGAERSRSV